MNIYQKINMWYEDDEHDKIIELILSLPENKRNIQLLGSLAVAYNNTGQHEKALEVLSSTYEEEKDNFQWYYRALYAYDELLMQEKDEEIIEQYLITMEEYIEKGKKLDKNNDYADDWEYFSSARQHILDFSEGDEDEQGSYFILKINCPLEPMTRHDLEDALGQLLEKNNIGIVDGGGTLFSDNGKIAATELDILLHDESLVNKLITAINEIGVPKNSILVNERTGENINVGLLEGLNFTVNINDEFYNYNLNDVVEKINKKLIGHGMYLANVESNESVQILFYGEKFSKMKKIITKYAENNLTKLSYTISSLEN